MKMKKSLLSVLSLVLLFTVLLGTLPVNVFAEEQAGDNPIQILAFSKKGNSESKKYRIYSFTKTTKVTVSDPSIATASFKNYKQSQGYGTCITVKFKKPGIVDVFETYISNSNGQKLETTETFKTVSYKSPVKSLIIGKNDLSKKVKHSHSFIGKSFKGKVSFKVNKGWKLYRMYKFKTSQLLTGGGVKQVSLKKNKSFKLNKGERLIVQFQKGSTIQSIRYDAK